jgi:hypothetical protein
LNQLVLLNDKAANSTASVLMSTGYTLPSQKGQQFVPMTDSSD